MEIDKGLIDGLLINIGWIPCLEFSFFYAILG